MAFPLKKILAEYFDSIFKLFNSLFIALLLQLGLQRIEASHWSYPDRDSDEGNCSININLHE